MCLNRDLGVVLFVVVSWISSLAYPSLPGIKGFVVVVVVVVLKKTPYELLIGRKPNISYFRVFGCKCFIYKKKRLGKFEK